MIPTAEIQAIFEQYPKTAQKKLYQLRDIILSVADQKQLGKVTEAVKWGEASYSCSGGTPVRIDWKHKHPENISMYFNCQTSIAEAVRAVFGSHLNVVGNREIRFHLKQTLPKKAISFCIDLCLRYHSIKHLPLLGVNSTSY